MKTKMVFLPLTGCLVALAAWLVHVPRSAQAADEIPEKYQGTVARALEYLAGNQHKDGHWEGDGGRHPVAMTGLVGIALLMDARPDPAMGGIRSRRKSKYWVNICKAADWLIDKSRAERDGLIFSDHPSETARYMQGHGLATLFLAGAYEDEDDQTRRRKFVDTLTRAVKYNLKAQSSQGGWYHTSRAEGHDLDAISATVFQIQALQAAENVGIAVPREAISGAHDYLKMALARYDAAADPGKSASRSADAAGALACRCMRGGFAARQEQDELCKKWFRYCENEIPVGRNIQFGRDELAHYYYAQAIFYRPGQGGWQDYRTAMFDHLKSSQKKDGSWPHGNVEIRNSKSESPDVGPVYSTALWSTILQLDRRNHPCMLRTFIEDDDLDRRPVVF